MNEANRAVFLSYASQDAEAAKRICEALRSGGVDVWFDADGGLEHGDEWDAKIRRQIKECVLFIPIISANTQARDEGYFRLEWDLAAERARTIASGVAFILPIVIDDTREPDALVPDRFRAVQWTKLRGGAVPPEVLTRFAKLWSHRTGVLKHEVSASAARESISTARSAAQSPGRPVAKHYAVIVAAIAIGLAGIGWWLRREPPHSASGGVASVAASKPAPASNPTEQAIKRAYAMIEKMSYTRSNLTAAQDLLHKATEQASDSARAWGARAYVESCFILRGWDASQPRREATQDFANRALALDASETEAMLALTYLLNQQRAFAQSEVMARRAIAIRPDDNRLHRTLGTAVNGAGRSEDALVIRQENVSLFPREPLIYYDLALQQRAQGDFSGALANFDQAIALQPFASALLQKVMLIAAFAGDLAGARATLQQIEPEDRTDDRAVAVAEWLGVLEHRTDRVVDAAGLTARDYLDDGIARAAKAHWLALAYEHDGKTALARQQWEAAEAILRRRVTDPAVVPSIPLDRALWATALARLGRTADATREIAPFEATVLEQTSPTNSNLPPISLAFFYAAMSDAPKAVTYARTTLNRTHFISDYTLAIDPVWDKVRAAPEFQALLAESTARIAAARTAGRKVINGPDGKAAEASVIDARKLP